MEKKGRLSALTASLIRPPGLWVSLFFFFYLCIGLWTYKDYGISWDEKVQRGTGAVSVKYVLNSFLPGYVAAHPEIGSVPDLHTYQDRDYGAVFEMILIIAEKATGQQENTAELFYLRHLLTFLFFFLALIYFYLLLFSRFKEWTWALAGTVLLAFTPRLFADAFYNTKDLVFLSAFTIGLYYLLRFLENRNWKNALCFGFAAAFAMDVRILGILLPLTGGAFLLWEWFFHGLTVNRRRTELIALAVFAGAFLLFTVLMWPFLWSDPIGNFIYAFKSMSKFRWEGKVFFLGQLYDARALPLSYIPVWMGVSSPLLVLMAFFPGAFLILKEMIRSRLLLFKTDAARRDVICLFLFAAPLLAVIGMKAVLYSGWRQMYFLYVPFLLVAMSGLYGLFQTQRNRITGMIIWGLMGLQVLELGWALTRLHPYGNVYFNVFAGGDPGAKFEMDYWGLAYREGLEQTLLQDQDSVIWLKVEAYPGKVNESMLSAADQNRVQYVESADSAEYYLGYRPLQGHEQAERIYSVEPGGMNILSVWRLK